MDEIWSLTARTKSPCPPIVLVMMEKTCQEYLVKIPNMAAAWCSTDGANCKILDSDARYMWRFQGEKIFYLYEFFTVLRLSGTTNRHTSEFTVNGSKKGKGCVRTIHTIHTIRYIGHTVNLLSATIFCMIVIALGIVCGEEAVVSEEAKLWMQWKEIKCIVKKRIKIKFWGKEKGWEESNHNALK